MRFLVAEPGPQFSVQDVYVGWTEALRELGHDVFEFNLADRLTFYDSSLLEVGDGAFRKALTADQAMQLAVNGLYAALYKIRPHVLLVVSGFFVPPEVLDLARASGTRVVMLHTESPYEDPRQLQVAEHADLNLVNDPTNLHVFQTLGPAEYMPHAYRPVLHHPGAAVPEMECDFAFVGTGFKSRIRFFEAMDLDGLDVLLAGNWMRLTEDSPLRKHLAHDAEDCLDNDQTADVYRSTKVGLNLYRREAQEENPYLDVAWAMGPREVEMAACGLFFLRDPRPESDEVLGMLPTFATPEDAGEQVRWWLAHPDQRARLAEQARAAVADRTFTRNATALLRLLDQKPANLGT